MWVGVLSCLIPFFSDSRRPREASIHPRSDQIGLYVAMRLLFSMRAACVLDTHPACPKSLAHASPTTEHTHIAPPRRQSGGATRQGDQPRGFGGVGVWGCGEGGDGC